MTTENLKTGKEYFRNLKNLGILSLVVGIVLMLSGSVNASVCYCDSCSVCNEKLNDPSCNIVKLNTSIVQVGTCINNPQNFNNKTFDCQGNTINGNNLWGYGIYLYSRQNSTIKNCIIIGFDNGIYLDYSSNNILTNNVANNNDNDGIRLYSSSNNILTNTTANNNYDGILLSSSSNNTLTNNTANNNYDGILLSSSSNNTLTNNTANNNEYGIHLYSSSNNTLTNNAVNNNWHGIYLNDASSNTFISNTVKFNKRDGFCALFSTSTGNIINANTFCSNNQLGGNYYDIYIGAGSTTGDNNICNTTYNYNDTGTEGCKNKCTECTEPKDVFDAVGILEYLSGQKDLGNQPYCDLNNDGTINLLDVLVLIDKIVTEG